MTIRVQDHLILRGFEAVMSMDSNATNVRRSIATVKMIDTVGRRIDRDHARHMYDKRIHKNAGDLMMKASKAQIEPMEGNIKGPVTINIVNTAKPPKGRQTAAVK